jgi:hypothetical protein
LALRKNLTPKAFAKNADAVSRTRKEALKAALPRTLGVMSKQASRSFAASPNRRLQFEKRSQLFIRVRNKTLSVVAVCVCNPDCSPVEINR